jgi:hypothetical protein
VPVPYFLLFLCFRKATQEIFSELDKKKPKFLFFPSVTESKAETEGSQRAATPPMARATPWPCQGMVWAPSPPPNATLPPIYSPRRENPKAPINFSTKHTVSRRRHRCKIGRVQKLFPAPCQREELPPEAFFITMPVSGVMCE